MPTDAPVFLMFVETSLKPNQGQKGSLTTAEAVCAYC